jgi:hypothetical protein
MTMWRHRLNNLKPKWPDKPLAGRDLEEQEQAVEKFRSWVVAQKAASGEKPEPGELSPRAGKVLIKCATEPGKGLMEVYQDLGLHPAEGKGAVDELLAHGFVCLHRLRRKGRGGQEVAVEITTQADGELAKRGIARAARVLGGGFKRDVYG